MACLAQNRSAYCRVGHPVRPAYARPVDPAIDNRRSRATRELSLLLRVERSEAPVEADSQLMITVGDRATEAATLFLREGHGFLKKDVLACFEGRERLIGVMLIAAQDHHHVYVSVMQDLLIIRATISRAEAPGIAFPSRAARRIDCVQSGARDLLQVREVGPSRKIACSYKCDAQFTRLLRR